MYNEIIEKQHQICDTYLQLKFENNFPFPFHRKELFDLIGTFFEYSNTPYNYHSGIDKKDNENTITLHLESDLDSPTSVLDEDLKKLLDAECEKLGINPPTITYNYEEYNFETYGDETGTLSFFEYCKKYAPEYSDIQERFETDLADEFEYTDLNPHRLIFNYYYGKQYPASITIFDLLNEEDSQKDFSKLNKDNVINITKSSIKDIMSTNAFKDKKIVFNQKFINLFNDFEDFKIKELKINNMFLNTKITYTLTDFSEDFAKYTSSEKENYFEIDEFAKKTFFYSLI
jgi:hypothetical protein